MVEIKGIVDRDSLRAWLIGRPQEVSVWIAHRNAMRMIPIWWDFVLTSDAVKLRDLTALMILSPNLISGVARVMPTTDIKRAARASASSAYVAHAAAETGRAAAYAANTAANTAAYAANTAAYAANTAAYDARAAASAAYAARAAANAAYAAAYWELIQADCEAITSGVDPDRLKLWGDQENPYEQMWAEVKAKLSTASPSRSEESARGAPNVDWSFWIKWYDDALNGTPPNWKMLERIALIDPEEWDKGAEVVNPLIAEIVAEYEGEPEAELTPQQALRKNANVVIAQLEALRIFVEEEIKRIRSPNDVTDEMREQINVRVVALQGIVEAIKKMITALADGDKAPQNALVVIEEQLPKVIEVADQLADQEPEVSEVLVMMGGTVEYLTKRGVPGHVASGLAGVDVAIRSIKKRLKRKKKNTE